MLRRGFLLLLPLLALGAAPASAPPVSEQAATLRTRGLALLENERPGEAGETFRQLSRLTPDDPLPWADLAIAALRQQKSEEAASAIAKGLAKAPGRADLLAIQGDILQWSGKDEEALAAYRKAAAAAPDRVTIQYALYHQAAQASSPDAEAARKESLQALARLRPENLVVLVQQGQRAIAVGDRAGATQAFLRVRELLGPTPSPAAAAVLAPVLAALESGDMAAVRVPGIRLENVLKPTPAYQQSLRELAPGILGVPVERFAAEPPPASFGDPLSVRFREAPLAKEPVAGRALAAGDFDGDEKPDLAWVFAGGGAGDAPRLLIHRGAGGDPVQGPEAPGIAGLLAADLDNDGKLDLIGFGPKRVAFWRGRGDGGFDDATAGAGLAKATGEAAAVLDYDAEGDLDLALGEPGIELFRNALQGALEPVGKSTFPPLPLSAIHELVASDLDRDGDLDLLIAHAKGIAWLDNLRQGRFADRTTASGFAAAGPVEAVASADLDNDGLPDVIAAGNGLTLWRNQGGKFAAWNLPGLPAGKRFTSVIAFDADNDGRLDLAAAGPDGIAILGQRGTLASPRFEPLPVEGAPAVAATLIAADLDGDGDLDLVTAGTSGLYRLENLGGNQNHWLDVRLRALTTGNGKNNLQGIGSVAEVRAGTAYQFREAAVPPVHFGLGRLRQADVLRVIWTNGVPQDRLQPRIDQRIVEEQVLKGSCPFLYAWNGERFAFVTDLLWNSPVGLPVAPGVWAGADPHELVRVDGARPADGVYRLRVTEELWEAAYFDAVRLWVVDHPSGVEVASSLRVVPGERQRVAVLAARDIHPVAAAWDGKGDDVTSRVRARDEVYAGGYEPGPYQGVAKPWTFTFDLGESPGTSVRLLLDGWIFPADASLNLAVAQRPDFPYLPPRLEVKTAKGWETLIPSMGFPAGKTKTMVVDTPPLPAGAHRLRIVTSLWLGWDRIAWTRATADGVPVVQARLEPRASDLQYRGFSRLIRRSPNGPHGYIYEDTAKDSPWIPFPGRYTRYDDVSELLTAVDDRSVILAPGDEIALEFDAAGLPPVAPGWRRTLFFESNGWDKDADRNTFEARQMEPLPFRAMEKYGDPFPDTPEMREYRERWLTREVGKPRH
ncbi:MAG TPA: FG-GAP-like repeat-containing protein [Thermoanaerobaculia bacterium]|jgi:Tfp pilus assembly protein PilF|nr:FG-GAP-like repeat-containing protein [Thermoanaerobaculia bacterium]